MCAAAPAATDAAAAGAAGVGAGFGAAAGAWAPALGVGPLISLTGLYFALVAVAGLAMPGLRSAAATAGAAG